MPGVRTCRLDAGLGRRGLCTTVARALALHRPTTSPTTAHRILIEPTTVWSAGAAVPVLRDGTRMTIPWNWKELVRLVHNVLPNLLSISKNSAPSRSQGLRIAHQVVGVGPLSVLPLSIVYQSFLL